MAEPVPRSQPATDVASALTWHRQVAATVEAAHRAGVLPAELPELRARLSAQATLLTTAAARIGGPLPALVPTPAEVASAGALLGDLSAPAVTNALRTMQSTLAAVDAALGSGDARTATAAAVPAPAAPTGDTPAPGPSSVAEPAPGGPAVGDSAVSGPAVSGPAVSGPVVSESAAGGPVVGEPAAGASPVSGPATPAESTVDGSAVDRLGRYGVGLRNAGVYGAYSAVVIAVQVVLFVLLDETRLPAAAPLCLIVLPALAWAAGWLSIGVLFSGVDGQQPDRTPRLGLVVCLLPNALLCAGIAAIFGLENIG